MCYIQGKTNRHDERVRNKGYKLKELLLLLFIGLQVYSITFDSIVNKRNSCFTFEEGDQIILRILFLLAFLKGPDGLSLYSHLALIKSRILILIRRI